MPRSCGVDVCARYLAHMGKALTLLRVSASAAHTPCTGSDITQPTNGQLGTNCDGVADVADGATCDLACDAGYYLSDQPTCTGGSLSSTTATCNACTTVTNAADGATYTCTSADDSDVSACAAQSSFDASNDQRTRKLRCVL